MFLANKPPEFLEDLMRALLLALTVAVLGLSAVSEAAGRRDQRMAETESSAPMTSRTLVTVSRPICGEGRSTSEMSESYAKANVNAVKGGWAVQPNVNITAIGNMIIGCSIASKTVRQSELD
jgi:hypothetical protein